MGPRQGLTLHFRVCHGASPNARPLPGPRARSRAVDHRHV